MLHPDEQEEMDMRLTTISESDRQAASFLGSKKPEQCWILSDRDVWYRNPYYHGPAMPHPEEQW